MFDNLRNFMKYDENGKLRPYYVGLEGEIHEVRHGVDTAYYAPDGYSQSFDGVFYLMINGLKCQAVRDIYGCNTSHEDLIVKSEKTMHEDGGRTIYTEMLVLGRCQTPMVKCTTTVLDSELRRVEEECKAEYFQF